MLIGIGIIISGIGWLKMHLDAQVFEKLKLGEDIPKQFLSALGMFEMLYKHHTLLGIIRLGLGLFIMVSAFYLLRLRAWARTALEIVSWFGLVLASALVALLVFIWSYFFSMSKEFEISISKGFEISIKDMLELITESSYMYNQFIYWSVRSVVYLCVVILLIILLRLKTVRNAVKSVTPMT